jgi:hypothetical protein
MKARLLCASTTGVYLKWATFDGVAWSGDTYFNNGAQSTSPPALASFNGKIYCVHRGQHGDDSLWWCTFDPATGTWSEDTQFTQDNRSSEGPALSAHEGRLICVHKGSLRGAWSTGRDDGLWWSSFTGNGWTEDQPFTQDNRTSAAPALASYGGKLYCVHKGSSDCNLWWSTFTGDGWTDDVQFAAGNLTDAQPALAATSTGLYCIHKGKDGGYRFYNSWLAEIAPDSPDLWIKLDNNGLNLWWCQFDPKTQQWTEDRLFEKGNLSADGPAAAVLDGVIHCVHRGRQNIMDDDTALWHTTFTGRGWTEDVEFPKRNHSRFTPALCALTADPQPLPVLSRGFDAAFYVESYPDLRAAFGSDRQAAARHWTDIGLPSEGRRGSPEFDVQFYFGKYADVRNQDRRYAAGYAHWLNYGIAEGRQGSREFDPNFYLALYSDLRAAFGSDYGAALDHWRTQGLPNEGRRGSAEFDVQFYLRRNPDLKAAFGTDYVGALRHWVTIGLPLEKRQGAPSG